MAEVVFDHVTKVFPGGTVAVEDLSLEVADGEFLILVGPSGCGKTTSLRMIAGLERIIRRRGPRGRQGRERRPAQGPRHRDGVPELRAVPPHDGGEEPRVRAAAAQHAPGRDRPPRRRDRRDAGAHRAAEAPARAAVGRPAAAGGDGPRARAGAEGVPARRAVVEPRREAARADARRAEAHPPAARYHDHLRHARPGGGHDARRPDRGDERWTPAAARCAAGGVRPSRERVRRGLHRVAGHEPAEGDAHRAAR